MGLGDARVIDAVGSMGTYMGLYCGLKNEGSPLRLTGIAISPFGEYKEKRIVEYFREMKENYGLEIDAVRADFDIVKDYTRGAYNNVCKEVRDAICYMAQKEAVMLDPCYTGKAFAGLMEMVKSGAIGELFFVESEYAHDYSKIPGHGGWRLDPRRHGFLGGGCHAVDLLRWIAGDPYEVYALANRKMLSTWPLVSRLLAMRLEL